MSIMSELGLVRFIGCVGVGSYWSGDATSYALRIPLFPLFPLIPFIPVQTKGLQVESHISLNIFTNKRFTDFLSSRSKLPNTLIMRLLSIAFIWSKQISSCLPSKLETSLVGMFLMVEVIGATMTVCKCVLATVGEMMRQGLTLLISFPLTGFKSTSTTSHFL